MGGWYAPIEGLGYDPDRAKALLAEAGAEDLEISLMIQNGIPRIKQAAVRIQAMLAQIGVKLEIQALEPNLFAQSARKHEFQAMIWSFGNNPKVDPTIKWHSDGKYNWMQVDDPEIDRLLKEAMSTTDLEKAQANVRKVQELVYALQPATFLYWEDSVSAIDGRFEDVRYNPFTDFELVENWWVPAEKQKYAR